VRARVFKVRDEEQGTVAPDFAFPLLLHAAAAACDVLPLPTGAASVLKVSPSVFLCGAGERSVVVGAGGRQLPPAIQQDQRFVTITHWLGGQARRAAHSEAGGCYATIMPTAA
jgi:hypothetical protein